MKHIIFDFDGTLFNSGEGIFQSFVVAAESVKLLPPSRSQIISAIGPPIHRLISLIYHNLSSDQISMMCLAFRQHYDTSGYRYSALYDGVFELIKSFVEDDDIQKISIVTNKPTLPTLKLLIENRLHKYFDNIIGIDYPAFFNNGTNYTSKAQALIELLHASSDYESTPIYIGDTVSDLEAARSACCHFVGVNYGFYCWKECHRAVLSIADTPNQLLDLISAF